MGTDFNTYIVNSKNYAAKVLKYRRLGLSTFWFVDVSVDVLVVDV